MREAYNAPNPSPFDQIARTDADGNAYWSARDLMPLMGYRNVNAWQPFRANVINRAMKTAENTGMTCAFTHVSERVTAGAGYTDRKDVHLDRMAAYLVAMNGDPNKPEVAAAQAYFAMQTRRAELSEVANHHPTPTCMTCNFIELNERSKGRKYGCDLPPYAIA